MSLLRARFDECQSVAGIGAAMGDRCPKSEHAKRQESVDLRHPQCSLKSVESAGHRKVRSIIEERGKSEESSQPMLHSSSSAIELCGAALGLAVSCTRTLHCRNNQSAISALRSAIKTAAATGCASKPADQTKSSQIKRSKTSRAYPKYVDGAALELTYLRRARPTKSASKDGHGSMASLTDLRPIFDDDTLMTAGILEVVASSLMAA